MSEIVVDASVALCWVVRQEQSAIANRLIGAAVDLIAPSLMLVELANSLWKKTRRGEAAAELGAAGMREVRRFVPQIVDVADLAEPAMQLAGELNHPVYDCVYLALARRRCARLVTLDQELITRLAKTRYRSDVVHLLDWS